jgi:hypothetical protein
MALSISQIVAASYPAVLAEARKPANQWAESALMRELERQGAIKRISFGPTIEAPLDYRSNAGADFLLTDTTSTSTTKTEVLTAASYTPAELVVPVNWSRGDEVKNPSMNQKVALVKSILENGLNSHDDKIESALFASSTNGFLGLQSLVPDSGQGVVGGIDAAVETFWRNHQATYASAGTDIEAAMTTAYNTIAKGTGSVLRPSLIVSGAAAQAIYEAQLQPQIRFIDTKEGDAGFKVLAFKDARYVFSHRGGTRIYFLSPKSFKLVVSKDNFRDRGEVQELPNATVFNMKIYSALQAVTNNKSRLAVLTQV